MKSTDYKLEMKNNIIYNVHVLYVPYLIAKYRIIFISTHRQAITLQLQIHRSVVVPNIWHFLNSFNLLTDNVCVVHSNKWDSHAHHFPDIWSPGPSAIYNSIGFDETNRGLHTSYSLHSKVINFGGNSSDRTILVNLKNGPVFVIQLNTFF